MKVEVADSFICAKAFLGVFQVLEGAPPDLPKAHCLLQAGQNGIEDIAKVVAEHLEVLQE